jgi:hypothetical protein
LSFRVSVGQMPAYTGSDGPVPAGRQQVHCQPGGPGQRMDQCPIWKSRQRRPRSQSGCQPGQNQQSRRAQFGQPEFKFDVRTSVNRTTVGNTRAKPKATQTCTNRVSSERPRISRAKSLRVSRPGQRLIPESAVDLTPSTIFCCTFLPLLLFGFPCSILNSFTSQARRSETTDKLKRTQLCRMTALEPR